MQETFAIAGSVTRMRSAIGALEEAWTGNGMDQVAPADLPQVSFS